MELMKATDKQLNLIRHMECFIMDSFKGETASEASEYISKHMDRYLSRRREYAENMPDPQDFM